MGKLLKRIGIIFVALVISPMLIMLSVVSSTFNFYGALGDMIRGKKI